MHKTLLTLLWMPLLTIAHGHLIPENPFSGIGEEPFVSTYVSKPLPTTLFYPKDGLGCFGRIFYANGTKKDIFLSPEDIQKWDSTELNIKNVLTSDLPYIVKSTLLFNNIAAWNQDLSIEAKQDLIILALASGIDINTTLYYYEFTTRGLQFRKSTLYSECDAELKEFLVSHGANKDYNFYPDWYLKLNAYKLFGTHLS